MIMRRGLSLIEMLMAILILGIGVISVAALFPAGIAMQRLSVDDVVGPIVANNAMALLRTKLSQDDFGTFQEFGVIDKSQIPPRGLNDFSQPAVFGDWGWMRPAFWSEDDTNTTTDDGTPLNEMGSIDVFAWDYSADQFGHPNKGIDTATEFPGGAISDSGEAVLFGIPYNTLKYDLDPDSSLPPPRAIFSQGERSYPMYAEYSASRTAQAHGAREPQYAWDVMFRRVDGRIQACVFVYRITFAPGQRAEYRVTPNVTSQAPPLPVKIDLRVAGGSLPWEGDPWDADADGNTDNGLQPVILIPGTDVGTEYSILAENQSWQAPRQWLVDQNGNVHRVLAGRENTEQGPVELQKPVPFMPPPTAGAGVLFDSPPMRYLVGSRDTSFQDVDDRWWEDVVTHLFYIPALRQVDLDGDGQTELVTLTPVFVKVEEL